ncbi:DNA-binding protein [Mycolicibacterium fortuitum]|uniref:DNA-binding protein n=1 Tax=Mycolicibacterium fortuitum TaxID=1766 RepID=A0AAE5AG10_MYCFO|nr:DNA-binding protein [Mycolicibacterium fortuitum]MDV7195786.1 DNA-binding protein [Mycolicibacterium fortuitum]MDV7207655.1 DNA-binding protein [Mycolicibacterium fortuitum]MDV7229711.1 DNA-binding protein [Mycolicibacterium fortuitum]MDV7261536.1 DNA-binding protein [Mycolicibacterium fortuitum]MDV7286684.1 DNA-binding protein [Mycolicibacterium fortuitum]
MIRLLAVMLLAAAPSFDQRLFSRAGAGRYLDKSLREIDRLISTGVLLAKKDGRRTVIDKSELDRYADRLPVIEPRSA